MSYNQKISIKRELKGSLLDEYVVECEDNCSKNISIKRELKVTEEGVM